MKQFTFAYSNLFTDNDIWDPIYAYDEMEFTPKPYDLSVASDDLAQKALTTTLRMEAPAAVIDLSTLTAAQGFIVQGDAAGDQAGWSVSSAGDVNGDGFDDLIVGAPFGNDGGGARR